MKAKTHAKDLMLLCKGWYDKEKYTTLKDALTAYYHNNYGCEDIKPDYGFINQILLKQAIQELLTEHNKHLLVNCLFETDVCDSWKYDDNHFKTIKLEYNEELYYRLTKFISKLQVIGDNDEIYIDTSDYWLKENDDYVIVDGHKVLKESIL